MYSLIINSEICMLSKYKIFYLFFILTIILNAQQVDFLTTKEKYYSSKIDTQKIRLLNILVENAPDELWPNYNDTLIETCLHKLKGETNEKTREYIKHYLGCGYNNRAVSLLNNRSLVEGINCYELSLENLSAVNDATLIITVLNNLGETYKYTGMYGKAADVYNKVLEKSLRLNYKPGIMSSYKFLGALYYRLKEYGKAKKYYKNSISICQQNKMEDDLTRVYNDIAQVYSLNGEADSCIYFLKESFNLKIKLKQMAGATKSLISIALRYTADGDFENAKLTLDQASELNKKINNPELNSYLQRANAAFFLGQKQFQKAHEFALKSWEYASKANDMSLKRGSSELLFQTYLSLNKGAEAYKMYLISSNLEDSTNSIELKNLSNEMEIKHEYEKKSIVDSLKRNDEIKLSNYKIEQQQTQKYILFIVVAIISVLSLIIFRRFRISIQQNKIIEKQKNEVEAKNKIISAKQTEILDSINYAKRIQQTLMPSEKYITKNLENLKKK